MNIRQSFISLLYDEMANNNDIVVLVGDLGYGLFDKIRLDYPDRFYNPLSAEQLMVGMAIGMAMEGKIPFCYSITPFLIYRPFELLRNYLNHEKIPVKLLGGGRDNEYASLGFSHWATDDKQNLNGLQNIQKFWPSADEELKSVMAVAINNSLPCYINLSKK